MTAERNFGHARPVSRGNPLTLRGYAWCCAGAVVIGALVWKAVMG